MYRPIDYLLLLLITFLSLKTIQTKSRDLKTNSTKSTVKQWWIEKHNASSTIIEDDQPETSFEICMPFYTCPTNLNRNILIILFPICLLICCCYYHCYEYCEVKRDLEQLQQYHHIDGSIQNKAFTI